MRTTTNQPRYALCNISHDGYATIVELSHGPGSPVPNTNGVVVVADDDAEIVDLWLSGVNGVPSVGQRFRL